MPSSAKDKRKKGVGKAGFGEMTRKRVRLVMQI